VHCRTKLTLKTLKNTSNKQFQLGNVFQLDKNLLNLVSFARHVLTRFYQAGKELWLKSHSERVMWYVSIVDIRDTDLIFLNHFL